MKCAGCVLNKVIGMQKKALVVDNDYFFVEFLSELLEKRGYQVAKAHNGKDGIEILSQGPITIVFADLVLPKVDGKQFFSFIRSKYNGNRFPIVAISGTMIEHMSALDEIGADYFIAKGPIDQLTVKLNEFMAEFETHPFFPPTDKKVVATGNVFPRRDAMELLNSLRFHQAVIEAAGVGIITVDNDTRIIHANSTALELVGKKSVDVINCPITDLFTNGEQDMLSESLNRVKHARRASKVSFCQTFLSGVIGATVSPIEIGGQIMGWVVVLESSVHTDGYASAM